MSIKVVKAAFMANFGIAVAKLVAAIFTSSASMFAEAVHSFADCSNQVLLWLGIKQSEKKPTSEHPLGFGKATYFWSFVVAIVLFSLGGVYSVVEGYSKLTGNTELHYPFVAIAVLLFGIVLEGLALKTCITEIREYTGELSISSVLKFFKDSRETSLIVVLAEDLAAVTGLTIALVCIILSVIFNDPMYDALGSILIGCLLIVVSIILSIEIKGLIIGQSVEPKVRKELLKHISKLPKIEHTYNLVTLQLGPYAICMLRIRFDTSLTGQELLTTIETTRQSILDNFKVFKHVFVEAVGPLSDDDDPSTHSKRI